MKQKSSILYEVLLAAVIIVLILLPQMIGTTTVIDESAGVDEEGLPLATTTFRDLEVPGTRFGTLTNSEWESEILKRFPNAELHRYNSMANSYAALEAGEVDAAIGFIDERKTLAGTHPELAFITEPFAIVDFGFGTRKSERGKALCRELNQYLAGLKASAPPTATCRITKP